MVDGRVGTVVSFRTPADLSVVQRANNERDLLLLLHPLMPRNETARRAGERRGGGSEGAL